jgi:hypothetical protein
MICASRMVKEHIYVTLKKQQNNQAFKNNKINKLATTFIIYLYEGLIKTQ